ncbi:RNA editing complex protein MP90, putative,nuclease, putative [Trypanosoma cruzi marinkellei]|uniref:RNA editing complex protein MP90, putative,nuclease, putative n=1 Tax=Trypanosoma cruzi marinkellei TaxID=85056 RepID=K2M455_TRYCR|nr:RNA editing complex protein MP90, putative,nuclease, putative [Trypanosoma cruzi marinkellei]
MPALKYLTIAEMEVMPSWFLWAAATFVTRLCECYFLSKAVGRRLSAPNRGIVLGTSPANLPPSAVGLGERIRHIIENNRKRNIKPTEKASAAIITDASLHGWEAVFVPDSGDVNFSGGKLERKPFLTTQAEARAVRLALSAFSTILPRTMDVLVDNTSLQGAANKGSSKSHASTLGLRRIYEFCTLSDYRHPLITCGPRSACRRHVARSCFYTSGIGEGERRGLLAEGPRSLPLCKE